MLTLKQKLGWKTSPPQDGAIYNGRLFRFHSNGSCMVYNVNDGAKEAEFTLSSIEKICPHSNSVFFGADKFDESDEYPLLYTNVYNNYCGQPDRRLGICCVYRLRKIGGSYITDLVQIIKIGFTDNVPLWKSLPDRGDVSP